MIVAIKCPKCHSDNPDTQKYCGECATPLPSDKDIRVSPTETLETPVEELSTGSTFAGRYQIIEEIGKGGMGKVYKTHDTEIREKVALKLIKPEISAEKKTIERFQNELKFARKVSHKNVCRMYDLNREKGSYYITMEYVSGEDLKSFIKRSGQLAIGTTIRIAKQVCEGLAEAHRLGVVHRDLKPSNVMIDEEGNARIMDFGIARSLKTKGITGSGVMIGTPEYMSPEQVEGKEVDQRSDIYSLGIILYEMVTGRVPFEGDTPFTVGVKHKSEEPKDPREFNTQIPDDLSKAILKCLEKDKNKRYQTAGEVRTELLNIEKGIPITEKAIPKRKPLTSKEITVTFRLKKLFIPALIFLSVVIAALIIWQTSKKEVVSLILGKSSIAVLPFEDLSPQKDQGYFCDGLAESLINALTKVKDIRIPASTSSFSFKGKERDVQEIGKELDVKTILEGSVQKAGNKFRITVKMINVADKSLLWSEQYNREMNDVFSIQDDITYEILDKLKVDILGEEKESLVKRYTENVEAYNLFLQGSYFLAKRTRDGAQKALECFQKAIEIDPAFALAYSGIASFYTLAGIYAVLPPKMAFPHAKAAAEKALEMDETLAEAHSDLAYVKMIFDWDWEGAEQGFKRALELNPNYPTAHQDYAYYLAIMGRFDKAISEIERARELDPLSLNLAQNMGNIFYLIGKPDRAIKEFERVIEMDPTYWLAHIYMSFPYANKGMYDKALTKVQEALEISEGSIPSAEWGLGMIYAWSDEADKANVVLEKLISMSKQTYIPPSFIARIYEGLGKRDKALDWFDKAYKIQDSWLVWLKFEPMFDSLRADPRFKAILKKMNLEK